MSDLPETSLSNTLQALSRALSVLGPDAQLHLGIRHDPRLDELITALPKLTEVDLDLDGICPICLVQFRAHLAEEEMALAMDSPAHASEDLGVTRLENTCRHVFCRKDISTWIRQSRNSCPTCRRPLLDPLPEESEEIHAPTSGQAREDQQRATAQMADEVVQEVLDALGMVNAGESNQVDSVRRLVETLLPDNFQLEAQPSDAEDQGYPDRSEFGMYS